MTNSLPLTLCLDLPISWRPLPSSLQLPVRPPLVRHKTRSNSNTCAEAEANYTYLPSNQTRTSIPFAATYCAGQFDNLLGPTTTGFGASLSSSCLSSILQNCNSYVAEYPVTTYFPNISSPCCGNQCDIWAVTARVLYWPTPAVSPNITSYMDEKGFTLYEHHALS